MQWPDVTSLIPVEVHTGGRVNPTAQQNVYETSIAFAHPECAPLLLFRPRCLDSAICGRNSCNQSYDSDQAWHSPTSWWDSTWTIWPNTIELPYGGHELDTWSPR